MKTLKFGVLAVALAVALAGCASIKGLADKATANDGMVAGLVSDEQAATYVDKVWGAGGNWLRDQAAMVALLHQIPPGLPVYYGIRKRGTDEWIDLTEYESVLQFAPIVKQMSASVPRLGNHVTPTPYLVPKPPSVPAFTVSNAPPAVPAAPVATNAAPTNAAPVVAPTNALPPVEVSDTPKARTNAAPETVPVVVAVPVLTATNELPKIVLPTNAAPARFTLQPLSASNAPPPIVDPKLESIIGEGL